MIADYFILGAFIVVLLMGLWLIVDELVEGEKRRKNPEDWDL